MTSYFRIKPCPDTKKTRAFTCLATACPVKDDAKLESLTKKLILLRPTGKKQMMKLIMGNNI